jgi:hypothetical protein
MPRTKRIDRLRAAVWATLSKTSSKELRRDDLKDGGKHDVNVRVYGQVDDEWFDEQIDATLYVGHKVRRASSTGPPMEDVVAFFLGHLGRTKKREVVDGMITQFRAFGKLEVEPTLIELAEELLSKMRQEKTVQVRGPLRVEKSAA